MFIFSLFHTLDSLESGKFLKDLNTKKEYSSVNLNYGIKYSTTRTMYMQPNNFSHLRVTNANNCSLENEFNVLVYNTGRGDKDTKNTSKKHFSGKAELYENVSS